MVDAGVADEDVEPPEARHRLAHHRLTGLWFRDLHRNESGVRPELRERLLRLFVGVRAAMTTAAPGLRKPLRHAKPDAAVAAGDEGDLAGQIEQVHRAGALLGDHDDRRVGRLADVPHKYNK